MSETETTRNKMTLAERLGAIESLRRAGVSDTVIGRALKVSRQRMWKLAGPRPPVDPLVKLTEDQNDLPGFLAAFRTRHKLTIARAASIVGTTTVQWWSWEQNRTRCILPVLLMRYLVFLDKNPADMPE